jgi:hypothetical protein
MSAVDSPQQRTPTTGSSGSDESDGASPLTSVQRATRSPAVLSVLACLVLAAISVAVLPTVPSYDPWSWIVWGREVSDPHLNFVVSGGPSWKPLPFIFTTLWGLFGGAAPALWIATARWGGLLGLVGAWRLASRLMGGGRPGAFAGLVAVAGVLLTQDWFYYFFHGTSEVVLIGASLWAIDRFLDGRHGQAFALAVAASLIRPEWWPFLGLYALWLWFRVPEFKTVRLRLFILAGLALIPVLWFGPPWVGSGQPFLAASHAAEYNGHLGSDPLRAVTARGKDLQVLPALIFGVIAVILGWLRGRDRLLLGLGLGVIAWWVVVVGMTLDGYPGLERFFLPAAALTCVLAGVGVTRLALLAGEGARHLGRSAALVPVATAAVAVVLVAISIPSSSDAITAARESFPANSQDASTQRQLSAAVKAVGGHDAVYPCRTSFAAVNHGMQTALAWKLHVTLEHVGTAMREPGVDFIGPHNGANGEEAAVDPRLTRERPLGGAGSWRAVQLTDPRLPTGCVGR